MAPDAKKLRRAVLILSLLALLGPIGSVRAENYGGYAYPPPPAQQPFSGWQAYSASPGGTQAYGSLGYNYSVSSSSGGQVYTQQNIQQYGTGANPAGAGPAVETDPATGGTSRAVVMHGLITPNGLPSTVWFEYGTSPALGTVSPSKSIGTEFASTKVNFYLYRVQPGATYYFRMVGQNQNGKSAGQVLTVSIPGAGTAPGQTYPAPGYSTSSVPGQTYSIPGYTYPAPYAQPPANTPTSSFFYQNWPDFGNVFRNQTSTATSGPAGTVSLAASVDNPTPKAGDMYTYSATYRNGSNRAMANAHLKVSLPAQVQFLGTNPAPAVSGNILDFNLGTLSPGVQGSITIPLKIDPSVPAGTSLTAISHMDYLDGSQARSADANYTVLVAGQIPAASVSGTSTGTAWYTILALVLIAAVILLGVYIAYRYVRVKRSMS